MGDFEQALLYYHRGYKLRPELQEFHLGIQKSKEAIDNSVGSKPSSDFFPKVVLKVIYICAQAWGLRRKFPREGCMKEFSCINVQF